MFCSVAAPRFGSANATTPQPPGVHEELDRLEAAGLVRSRRLGHTHLVRTDVLALSVEPPGR